MKTLELDLKKKVLIVQPEETGNMNYWVTLHSKDWDFICKGSELTEEIASELVKTTWIHDKKILCKYKNYNSEGDGSYFSAVKSFKSAIESKGFYWLENPISLERVIIYESLGDTFKSNGIKKVWQKAQEKTFKNPLIFVKNA